MSIFRRQQQPEPPARRPHPDARVEAELQRILSLRNAVARKEDLAARNHQQVTALRETVARHPTWDGTVTRKHQIADLLGEIAKRIAALSDTDVAYL